jgi:hypothetical protein
MIESKDVVVGALGAAAALAGLVLVFLGIIIAAYQSYSGGTSEDIVRPYRITGIALFAAFSLSLVSVAISLMWLVFDGPTGLYGWVVGVFISQLVIVFVAAGWASRMALWQ